MIHPWCFIYMSVAVMKYRRWKKMFLLVGPCQIFNKGCERNSQKHRRGGQLLRTVRYTIFIISPCMSLQSLWAHQHAVLVDSDYFDLAWAPRAVNMFLRTFPFWQSIILLKKRPGERKKDSEIVTLPTETDPLRGLLIRPSRIKKKRLWTDLIWI